MTIKIYDAKNNEIFSVVLTKEPELEDVNRLLALFIKQTKGKK